MKPKQQKAFTLIELLVVIAIIGILSTLAVVSLQNARKSARDAKRVSDIKQIQTALELYYQDHDSYPDNLSSGNPIEEDGITYMQTFPQAPTPADGDCNQENNKYDYQQENNGSNYSLTFCLGSKTGDIESGVKTAGVGGIGSSSFRCGSNITDARDQNVYPTVKIGSQCWMAKNLAYLPEVFERLEGSTSSPRYYVYGYDGTDVAAAKATANYITYGVLYNFPAAIQEGICPAGWHVPSDGDGDGESDREWGILVDHLGGTSVAGGKMKATGTMEASTGYWLFPNTGATNESGFNALPAGERLDDGSFGGLSFYTGWWFSSLADDIAWARYLYFDEAVVDRGSRDRSNGCSLRCLQD